MAKKAFDQIAAGLAEALAAARGDADPTTYKIHTLEDIKQMKIARKVIKRGQNVWEQLAKR